MVHFEARREQYCADVFAKRSPSYQILLLTVYWMNDKARPIKHNSCAPSITDCLSLFQSTKYFKYIYLCSANARSILNCIIFLRIDYNQSSIHIIIQILLKPNQGSNIRSDRNQPLLTRYKTKMITSNILYILPFIYLIVFIHKYSEYLCVHK